MYLYIHIIWCNILIYQQYPQDQPVLRIPTPFTPLMAPLSQLGRLGLSPRRVTAPAIPTASSAPSAPAPAPAAAAQATPALAFTEPVTALSGRGIQRAVNVLTAGAPLTTGSSDLGLKFWKSKTFGIGNLHLVEAPK